MNTERRRRQLEREGIHVESVENMAEEFINKMKAQGMTIKEGFLVTKKMDCILEEMIKCNPNSEIK